MLMRKMIIIGIIGTLGVSMDAVAELQLPERTMVCEMYVAECPDCGNHLMEGCYSYVSNDGYEQCKDCGYYRDIDNNK